MDGVTNKKVIVSIFFERLPLLALLRPHGLIGHGEECRTLPMA
jgi:hypothetical protein